MQRFIFLLGIALISHVLHAQQTGTVSGYVKDAETDETLISANIYIKESGKGTISNKSGFYSLANLPPGTYSIVYSFIGYKSEERTVTISPGSTQTLHVKLNPEVLRLNEVVVEAERDEDRRQISVSRINIPAAQIAQIRIGGEADVFRSLQFLPGILSSSQISSGLYIRGGSPDQTLVLLDGSTVYNPSHLFGFFSTFNPEAIKDVDLIKGGYPAEYGGRLSAVLDLVQKDGNRYKTEGLVSLGLISSRASGQGPVGNGSWFLGARRTYVDLITSVLETEEDPLPDYYFYDVNGKISQEFGKSDKVFLSGFMSEDDLEFNNNSGFRSGIGISNRLGSSRWTHLFSANVFSVFNLSWSRYRNNFYTDAAGFSTKFENTITDMTLKGNVEWFISSDVNVKGGAEVTYYDFRFEQDFSGSANSNNGDEKGGVRKIDAYDYTYAFFGQTNYQFDERFSVQTGLRLNYYDHRGLLTFDPRVAVRYQWSPELAFKAAWGLYHQYFRLASLPDFSFFDTWLPTDSTVNPGRADQYILGIETKPTDGIVFNFDAYYKRLKNISELNQFATQGDRVADYFFDGRGEAFGFEVFVQKKEGRLTGWAGYALGFVNAQFDAINEGRWFRPKWDRRHDMKVVAQYKLSDDWDIGATFTFQSGQSYTGMTSRAASYLPGDDIGWGITVPAEKYGLRLPPSHQLNLNVNYHFTMFTLPASLLIDIYNVYSRRDIWFRYYDTTGDITEVKDTKLLPILPSVALEVRF